MKTIKEERVHADIRQGQRRLKNGCSVKIHSIKVLLQ
jgi:hypothetical protein